MGYAEKTVLRIMAALIYSGYTSKNGSPEIGVERRVENCVRAAQEIMKQTEEPR